MGRQNNNRRSKHAPATWGRPRIGAIEALEDRRMLAVLYDLSAEWSDVENPNGPWSLNEGNNRLSHFAHWNATSQAAWAVAANGVSNTPAWFKASELALADAQPGDLVVAPTTSNSGNGAANVTWTSPGDGVISVEGSIWAATDRVTDHYWTLYVDSEAVSTGTMLAGEFNRDRQFDLALGSGGLGAVRNVSVEAGDVLKLALTSSQSDYLGVNLSVSFDSSGISQFDLGSIPTNLSTNGQAVSFFVGLPQGQAGELSIEANPQPLGAINFDGSTGQFMYVPDPRDKFDFTVVFSAGDGGTWDAPAAQTITISPNSVRPEFDLVSVAKPLPDPQSRDYITVSETVNQLPPGSYFNATPRTSTKNVEISGKDVHLTPGHANGLYERFAYAGLSTVNTNIQNLSIYAETVVIGGHLRLPQTNVTIYAKELIFEDEATTARIDTTPLDYSTSVPQAGQFADGRAGENAGNIELHVESVAEPDGAPTTQRFLLRGGTGQGAGQGKAGDPGPAMPGNGGYPGLAAGYQVVHLANASGGTIFGERRWPDGSAAIPGGAPGRGGSGGTFRTYVVNGDVPSADVSGGAAGPKALDRSGGPAGTPLRAAWAVFRGFQNYTFTYHNTVAGSSWIAPAGASGAVGTTEIIRPSDFDALDWMHPTALRAMMSHAKDAYVNGNIDYAAKVLGEYGRVVDLMASPPDQFAQVFKEIRREIAELENQAVNRLDYFGNPLGWAPTLNFAANLIAYRNQIDSDIRILYLSRLMQTSAANQQNLVGAINNSLDQLNDDVARAADSFNSAQLLLPELQHQLDVILAQTSLVEERLAETEQDLKARAESNVADRHRVPFWKKALKTVAAVAQAVPIPVVSAIGTGLSLVSNFLDNPKVSNLDTFKGITNPFTKARLDQSSEELKNQFAQLKQPKDANLGELKSYVRGLADLGKKWAPVLDAFKNATKATEVPASEIEAELMKLKAEDPAFGALVNELSTLSGLKEVFAQDLARTLQTISDSAKQISSDYVAADALTTQLSDLLGGLRHDTLVQIKEMERTARDRLLKYQYYMAKAFEYEILQPYTGNFQLSHLLDAITLQLSNNTDANWLDDPANFNALKSIYESDLEGTADQIWTNLNTNGPLRTSNVDFRLSPSQVDALNTQGQVTINLVEMGFIAPSKPNAKILQMGASQITSAVSDPSAQAANIQLDFVHSGNSVVQRNGQKYAFEHYTSRTETPIFWRTDYNAFSTGPPVQAGISPSQIAAIASILGLDLTAVSPDQAGLLYAHPSAWADITIRKTDTVVPTSVTVELDEVWLTVRYDSDFPQLNTVVLEVLTDEELSPQILVDKTDFSDRTDGLGSFVRFFNQGEVVTLTAQPIYGRFAFQDWRTVAGNVVSSTPRFTTTLAGRLQVEATYVEMPAPGLPGDHDQDGDVDQTDLTLWRGNFGVVGQTAPQVGDADSDRDVDGNDFLVWQRNVGLQLSLPAVQAYSTESVTAAVSTPIRSDYARPLESSLRREPFLASGMEGVRVPVNPTAARDAAFGSTRPNAYRPTLADYEATAALPAPMDWFRRRGLIPAEPLGFKATNEHATESEREGHIGEDLELAFASM